MSETGRPLPTCREIVDRLPDWSEGLLAEEAVEPYLRHLELCPPCGSFARTYRALARVARAALQVKMPQAAAERLRRAVAERLGNSS